MNINILIINYNEKKLTEKSIDSIQDTDVKIVLVENGCKKEEIMEEDGFTHLFLNHNYGFPAAVNVGVKASEGEWVLVLNNDCVLRENFIEVMEKEIDSCLRRNDSYQIFSPKIYQEKRKSKDSSRRWNDRGVIANDDREYGNNKGDYRNDKGVCRNDIEENIIYACGDRIDNKGLAGNIGRGEVDHGQYDSQQEVPLASFACILIKKEILEKFPLDESYFGYYEDVDFCLRVARAGYKIRFVPKAVCYHAGEASFGKLNNLNNEMRQFRNLSFTVIKNYSLFHIVRHWMIFNLKSFRYYFFMKKQWKFLWIEWQIMRKLLCFWEIRHFCGSA